MNLEEEHERRRKEEWGIKTQLEIRRTQVRDLRKEEGAACNGIGEAVKRRGGLFWVLKKREKE